MCNFTVTTFLCLLIFINAIVANKYNLSSTNQYPTNYESYLQDGEIFDFIVVGAGSAGCVVANRLSENPNWKVLLIEAGTYPSAESEVPSLAPSLQTTNENWKYMCEPSEYLRFRKKTYCPRGKGLGGSSLINYMVYFRGNRYDYDQWERDGNEGWGFDSILPLYQKFENFQNGSHYRFGINGEMKIAKSIATDPVIFSIIDAYKELNYSTDYNEEHPFGITPAYSTIANGKRYNTAKAFLTGNVSNRSNLFLVLNSQVSKLIVESETVKGVELHLKNKVLKIYAMKEVILSAGTVNSPQILMNSGIGPKLHLQKIGINTIKDLQVGKNLQDHILFLGMNFKLSQSALNNNAIYVRSGGFRSHVFGFINPKNNTNFPSLQVYYILKSQKLFPTPPKNHTKTLRGFELPLNLTNTIEEVNTKTSIIEIVLALLYPKSRGKILLRSSNPLDYPLIFPDYLSNHTDIDSIIDGIRFVQKLMRTQSLRTYKPEFIKYYIEECEKFVFDTDEYWDCHIRYLVRTNFHLVGSCKMGPENDPDAVVDSGLKVYGFKGIRVVDGSIMPTIVGANTNGPIILIGEKGSEMIRNDWTNK